MTALPNVSSTNEDAVPNDLSPQPQAHTIFPRPSLSQPCHPIFRSTSHDLMSHPPASRPFASSNVVVQHPTPQPTTPENYTPVPQTALQRGSAQNEQSPSRSSSSMPPSHLPSRLPSNETTANDNRTLPERIHDVHIHHRRVRSSLPSRAPISKRRKASGSSHKGTTGRRGSGFSQSETENLLELSEEYLPLGKEEWENVSRLHEARYPIQRRNADSLRRKFSALCRTIVTTGDPSIPLEVFQAKRIREQMTERADIGDGAESGDEYTEGVNEETAALPSSVFETNGTDGATVTPDAGEGSVAGLTAASPPSSHRNTPSTSASPRPLVRKQAMYNSKQQNDDDSILSAIKASMLCEQMRFDAEHQQGMLDREDEKRRQDEERRLRGERRAVEREWREEERRRSERMMQMMMIALLGQRAKDVLKDSNETGN